MVTTFDDVESLWLDDEKFYGLVYGCHVAPLISVGLKSIVFTSSLFNRLDALKARRLGRIPGTTPRSSMRRQYYACATCQHLSSRHVSKAPISPRMV